MRYGIRRITVEELCRKAGTSKMTFYKYFRNKNDLARCLIRRIYEIGFRRYREIMDSPLPIEKKVEKFVDMKMEMAKSISPEFMEDLLENSDPEILELVSRMREEGIHQMLGDLEAASQRGEIRKDLKPEFIEFFLNHLVELAKNPALKALYPSPKQLTGELLNFFFYGILNR
jgi:AcrR family transcriptional regulator